MAERRRVAEFWNEVVAEFLEGGSPMPPPLDRWLAAYDGSGSGAIDPEAFVEPFVGPLLGEVRAVILGLNPGKSNPGFQHRDGIFAAEIRRFGSYSAWAASWPYLRDPWVSTVGPNRYARARLSFARRWVGDPELGREHLVTLELFPWHSTGLTAPIGPEASIVHDFILAPIAETGVRHAFAFGKDWFTILNLMGLERLARLGLEGDPYGSRVPNRAIEVFDAGSFLIVAERHEGSAIPPAADEVEVLREALEKRGLG